MMDLDFITMIENMKGNLLILRSWLAAYALISFLFHDHPEQISTLQLQHSDELNLNVKVFTFFSRRDTDARDALLPEAAVAVGMARRDTSVFEAFLTGPAITGLGAFAKAVQAKLRSWAGPNTKSRFWSKTI